VVAGNAEGGSGSPPRGKPAGSQIAGEYELVRYFGQALPADNFGRGTVEAKHLSLLPDQRFTRTYRGEICILGSCGRADGSESGVWMILADGTLYLDSTPSTSWPPPRIVADGREVRVMIPSGNNQFSLSEVYQRR